MTDSTENRGKAKNAERARQIIEAYGADPARWPADERAAMVALVGTPAELSATLASATQLDTLLDALPGADASLALIERVMSAAPGAMPDNQALWQARRPSPAGHSSLADWLSGGWPWEPVLRPAAALALSALFGVMVGIFSAPPNAVNIDEPDLTWELAFAPAAIVTEDMR